jgi:hypothetical protein
MSLTKLSLGGNYDAICELFLPRKSLVTDIPAGDGNIEKIFLRCILVSHRIDSKKDKKNHQSTTENAAQIFNKKQYTFQDLGILYLL